MHDQPQASPLISGPDTARRVIETAEHHRRLAAAAAAEATDAINTSRVYVDQGHQSARITYSHLAGTSRSDTFRLDQIRQMINNHRLHTHASTWADDSLGVEQVALLAKVYANPRVRYQFINDQTWFIDQAQTLSYAQFKTRIARWLELIDENGPTPKPDPTHDRRAASMTQDHFSKAWHLNANLGSLDGSRFNEIFDAYTQAEFVLRLISRDRSADVSSSI